MMQKTHRPQWRYTVHKCNAGKRCKAPHPLIHLILRTLSGKHLDTYIYLGIIALK